MISNQTDCRSSAIFYNSKYDPAVVLLRFIEPKITIFPDIEPNRNSDFLSRFFYFLGMCRTPVQLLVPAGFHSAGTGITQPLCLEIPSQQVMINTVSMSSCPCLCPLAQPPQGFYKWTSNQHCLFV
jgi:hypothetical protein